eukprot:CAMPEP_0202894416 /NCGR_PEP_ID=MMETSP1392-20130828/3834_1 /ASSEMBLY_ACC=CAM_ASM_000868 /TAXON_ID=225041 /ORGANISM="Chlamydomonas chlamydogama, Strain SAG 11-48b" /LENGTH=50 /DNA_ID=CAMNT_0049579115 /DNA_START=406 /DNA_END=558 /DNA_ORIENTATION=+
MLDTFTGKTGDTPVSKDMADAGHASGSTSYPALVRAAQPAGCTRCPPPRQ